MERRFVVLSHGVGDCRDMMRISCKRTIAWCKQHDMDFRASTRRECEHHVYWDKPFFIKRMLAEYPEGSDFLWIDADCIPVQTDVSPRGVLGDAEFGARWVTPQDANLKNSFYQSGVQFIRNTTATRELFKRICEYATDPSISTTVPPVWDEDAMNREVAKGYVKVKAIAPEWNAFRQDEFAIIRGYHSWTHERVKEKLADELCCSVRKIRKEG